MTEQHQAIAALIEAIEAGEFDAPTKRAARYNDFMSVAEFALPVKRGGWPGFWPAMKSWRAYNGSLDAALSLHNAILVGCSQYSVVTDPTCLCVKVAWWPDGLSGKTCFQGEGWSEATTARAWLLAILRAYASQLPAPYNSKGAEE